MNKKLINTYRDETPLDDYEKELKEFLDKGEYVSDQNFEENKKMFEVAAKNFVDLQQSKSITLRIKKKDLIRLKAKAAKNNIPYQTLVGLLINSYNEGKTKLSL